MRFKCGPTLAELRCRREERLQQWHNFFVLWPRRIGDECVWLETVRRKGRLHQGGYGGAYWYWEFRLSITAELES